MSRAFYKSGAALRDIPDERRYAFWEGLTRGGLIDGFIIESDGAVAGYALVAYYASQELGGRVTFIDEIYIKPEFRGKSLARQFFDYVNENSVACRLEVEKDNIKALSLYSDMGFEVNKYIQMQKKR